MKVETGSAPSRTRVMHALKRPHTGVRHVRYTLYIATLPPVEVTRESAAKVLGHAAHRHELDRSIGRRVFSLATSTGTDRFYLAVSVR